MAENRQRRAPRHSYGKLLPRPKSFWYSQPNAVYRSSTRNSRTGRYTKTRWVLDARRDAEQRDTADANVRHVIGPAEFLNRAHSLLLQKCAQRRDHSPGTIRPDS